MVDVVLPRRKAVPDLLRLILSSRPLALPDLAIERGILQGDAGWRDRAMLGPFRVGRAQGSGDGMYASCRVLLVSFPVAAMRLWQLTLEHRVLGE
jgi:hypothetical protein